MQGLTHPDYLQRSVLLTIYVNILAIIVNILAIIVDIFYCSALDCLDFFDS